VRRSFLRFPDEIIPRLINLAARKFHLRFSLIFALLKTLLSLIPAKEKCVWVVAVKAVDVCQFTLGEGSDRLFVFDFVMRIDIKPSAGFCLHPDAAGLAGGDIPGSWDAEARPGGGGGPSRALGQGAAG